MVRLGRTAKKDAKNAGGSSPNGPSGRRHSSTPDPPTVTSPDPKPEFKMPNIVHKIAVGVVGLVIGDQLIKQFEQEVDEFVDKVWGFLPEMAQELFAPPSLGKIVAIFIIPFLILSAFFVFKPSKNKNNTDNTDNISESTDTTGVLEGTGDINGGGKKKKISKNVYLLIICVFIYFIYELSLKYQKLKTNKQKLEKLKK